ncbi:hypothetical protein RHGRI_011441 [Rhododendron griersonianum]|nr:hypothetical protein RHGRI_011441 [Rhododendron griersonianum]
MAQTKVKRLLAYSSIGHVGYIRTGFSCGTIEGIQSLLIGIFIYASMTIDAFAIVSALRQTHVKYSGFGRSSQNESYFGYYLIHYYVLIHRNTPVSRLL